MATVAGPRLTANQILWLRHGRRWALVFSYLALFVFMIFLLGPPYYMLVTSLKTTQEIANLATNPWVVADGITFEHYWNLFAETGFLTSFKSTVIVTLAVVAITMVVSVLAAYALARLRFWGAGFLALGIFLTYLVPETLLFIPLFKLIGWLGLLNDYLSLIVVYPTISIPFFPLDHDRLFQLDPARARRCGPDRRL